MGQGKGCSGGASMRLRGMARMEIVAESNDPVRLSFLLVLLRDAGLEPILYDSNMAATLGGAVRQRIAVTADQAMQARRVLREAGEACPD
jgi:hypothetical protein